jgi:hypothetical protein
MTKVSSSASYEQRGCLDPMWSCILQDYSEDEGHGWNLGSRLKDWKETKEEAKRTKKKKKEESLAKNEGATAVMVLISGR